LKIQKIKKLFGATKMIRGRKVRLLPLLIIFILMVGVAADLIVHYTVDVTTSGGEVLGDPYWTEFTDLENVTVTNVPLPDVVQNTYEDTLTYRLSLVNPDIKVAMVFEVTGTLNAGIAIEAYLEMGETDVLWDEGNNYAILMGINGYGGSVDLYFRVSATWDAAVGALGDSIGFRFIACENPIIPFMLSADITQGPDVELQNVVTSAMQTTIDFRTITPEDLVVINEDYMLYGLSHVQVQYAWTGLPADVHIAVDWSDDLGSTWNVWAPDVKYDILSAEELRLRFSITADAGSDHSSGLSIGLVLTESDPIVDPFNMYADMTKSGSTTNMELLVSGIAGTSLDFGMITQGTPLVYSGLKIRILNSNTKIRYAWTYLPSDVTIGMQYKIDATWVTWNVGEDVPSQIPGTLVYLRFTITADGNAEYPTGLTVVIDFYSS